MELVYILENRVELGIVYFFDRLYSEQFFFYIGVPRLYLDIFNSGKILISVFYMREQS